MYLKIGSFKFNVGRRNSAVFELMIFNCQYRNIQTFNIDIYLTKNDIRILPWNLKVFKLKSFFRIM